MSVPEKTKKPMSVLLERRSTASQPQPDVAKTNPAMIPQSGRFPHPRGRKAHEVASLTGQIDPIKRQWTPDAKVLAVDLQDRNGFLFEVIGVPEGVQAAKSRRPDVQYPGGRVAIIFSSRGDALFERNQA